MRALLALTVAMGVVIVVGSIGLVVLLIKRSEVPVTSAAAFSVTLDEPAGTHIASLTAFGDRMAVQLQGGGPDRVLLVDSRTGGVLGRITLQK